MGDSQIESLHRAYCEETRLNVQCSMFRIMAWEGFIHRGFTQDDLVLVCRGLRRLVDQGQRTIGYLSFHRLISDLDIFDEHLAAFRSLQRKPKFSPGKSDVLKATGRASEPETAAAKPVSKSIERLKLADKLKNWREKNL